MKIVCVCGARPNFMKIAPLLRALRRQSGVSALLVHTGQHYDEAMNQRFFDELNIPRPDVNLEVGSGSHAQQTGLVMQRFEPVVLAHQPDAVLVVGDVNSTLACALVAAKLDIPVFHVEAGLRSFDRTMPEELNRVLTDALSELLLVSEPSGVRNLEREGIDPRRVHLVGNVMIDTLRAHQPLAERSDVLARLELTPRRYGVLTLHRPANVDDPQVFGRILDALERIAREHTIVFPVHPRTHANLARTGLAPRAAALRGLKLIEPLGYLDFMKLLSAAALVLTDSGGIQEETTVLGVPCLTLRENTERPITIEQGTNQLVGTEPAAILRGYEHIQRSTGVARIPDLWDGRAAERISAVIANWWAAHSGAPAKTLAVVPGAASVSPTARR